MKLNLTVYQREALMIAAGSLSGRCAVMHNGIKIRDAVCLSKAEKKQVSYAVTRNGSTWNDVEYRAEIEINDPEALELAKRLTRQIIERSEKRAAWQLGPFEEMRNLADQMHLDFDAIIADVVAKKQQEEEKNVTEESKPGK